MDFSKFTISKKYKRNDLEYELFFDFDIIQHAGHKRKTFDDYKSLLYFLETNPEKRIYITLTQIQDSYEEDNKLVVNLTEYQAFCKKIGQNGRNRTQAFLAQKLKHYSEEDRKKIIAGSTEQEIIERIKEFKPEQKIIFLESLKKIEDIQLPTGDLKDISVEDFLPAFLDFLKDPKKQEIIAANYSQVQIQILEEHKKFLEDNLNKKETFITDWIDGKIDNAGNTMSYSAEEIKKLKKSRCLIFGLEFISHRREGNTSSRRFDVLTKISEGKNEYVLIELKSPSGDVFKVVEKQNANEGKSTEYHLSEDTARGIPQISDYRRLLENDTSSAEWQKIGLPEGKIAKCLILIGTRKKEDSVWEEHFLSLRRNLSSSIEIMTYTDLIQKLDTTIKNLKENL